MTEWMNPKQDSFVTHNVLRHCGDAFRLRVNIGILTNHRATRNRENTSSSRRGQVCARGLCLYLKNTVGNNTHHHAMELAAMPAIWTFSHVPWFLLAILLLYTVKKVCDLVRASCDLHLMSRRDPPEDYFFGKVVWVVGASQGIGKALAARWVACGARVILSSRNIDSLSALKKELVSLPGIKDGDVFVLPIDITDGFPQVERTAQLAYQKFGILDYVVYNVGASQHAPVEETSHQVAEQLLGMNFTGQVALARALQPIFLSQGHGHHVVIASMASIVPSPGQAIYSATKSALRSYFLSMAAELHSRGIHVSVICPGPVDVGDSVQMRKVYGRDGLIQQKNTSKSSSRVSVDIFTKLALRAVYNNVDECWISKNPVLLMGYLLRLFPLVGMKVLKKIGPGRVRQFDKGTGTGYDVLNMLQDKKD